MNFKELSKINDSTNKRVRVSDAEESKFYVVKAVDEKGVEHWVKTKDGIDLEFTDKITKDCIHEDIPVDGVRGSRVFKEMVDLWKEENPEYDFQCYEWDYEKGLGDKYEFKEEK